MSRSDQVEAFDSIIQLSDGRTLAYAEYGESSGKALLYFHGGADSRLGFQSGSPLVGLATMWSSWQTTCTSTA